MSKFAWVLNYWVFFPALVKVIKTLPNVFLISLAPFSHKDQGWFKKSISFFNVFYDDMNLNLAYVYSQQWEEKKKEND